MTTKLLRQLDAAIALCDKPEPRMEFNPRRWPYTYAYDFVRGHSECFTEALGIDESHPNWPWLSRADVAGLISARAGEGHGANELKRMVCERLAAAYCRENRITVPEGV